MTENDWLDDLLQVYLDAVRRTPAINQEEERACFEHVRLQDELASVSQTRLVEANLHLVISIAEAYPNLNPQVHLVDLIEAGNYGLMTAVSSFDRLAAVLFPAFAAKLIEAAVASASAPPSVGIDG